MNPKSFQNIDDVEPTRIETPDSKRNITSHLPSYCKQKATSIIGMQSKFWALKKNSTDALDLKKERTVTAPTEPTTTERPINNQSFQSNAEIQSVLIDNFANKQKIVSDVPSNSWKEVKSKTFVGKRQNSLSEQTETIAIIRTLPLTKRQVTNKSSQNIAGIQPVVIHQSVDKQQVATTIPSSFNREAKDKTEAASNVDKTQNNSLVGKKGQSVKATTNKHAKPLTILESIRFYATSIPAFALYLILLMISFNPLKYWHSENT